MKLPTLRIYPFYCAGLLLTALFAWLTAVVYMHYPAFEALHWFWRLLPAIILYIGALILHNCSKKRSALYLLSYFFNSAASGIAIGVLLKTKLLAATAALLAALIPAAVLGLLTCVVLSFVRNRAKLVAICLCVLGLAFVVFGCWTLISKNEFPGWVYIFSGLFFLPLPISCVKLANNPDGFMRYLSFSGFGAFMAIFFVVLLCLTDGEGLDSIDLPDILSDSPSDRKNKPPKQTGLEKGVEKFITFMSNKMKKK